MEGVVDCEVVRGRVCGRVCEMQGRDAGQSGQTDTGVDRRVSLPMNLWRWDGNPATLEGVDMPSTGGLGTSAAALGTGCCLPPIRCRLVSTSCSGRWQWRSWPDRGRRGSGECVWRVEVISFSSLFARSLLSRIPSLAATTTRPPYCSVNPQT